MSTEQKYSAPESMNAGLSNHTGMALYVHLPWCERKCPYCDFNSHKSPDKIPENRYVDSLVADLRSDIHRMERCGVEIKPIQTMFLGGGTPSLFSVDSIVNIVQSVDAIISLAKDCEITMEVNPGSLESARLPGFRRAGINRLSVGAQSLNDKHLRTIGRVHNSDQVRTALENAMAVGFDRINVDLMYGLPNQSIDEALEDLRIVERLDLKHLSWYELTIEPNTAFGWRPPNGLPDEKLSIAMRAEGGAYLHSVGLSAYEVSAWASSPQERCRHNLNYWNYGDYIGIGGGAHGKLTLPSTRQVLRGHKYRSPLTYMKACLDTPFQLSEDQMNSVALEYREIVTPESATNEFLLNALRLTEGFDLNHWRACTAMDEKILLEAAANLIDSGDISHHNNRIFVSPKSKSFLDDVITRLCLALDNAYTRQGGSPESASGATAPPASQAPLKYTEKATIPLKNVATIPPKT